MYKNKSVFQFKTTADSLVNFCCKSAMLWDGC